MNTEMSTFAKTIMEQKYSHTKTDGTKESWEEIADRTVDNVLSPVPLDAYTKRKIKEAVKQKKLMPGGRYLFAAGNPYHQTQNCALFRADDSREGWADLLHKICMALMTGAGVGVVYSDLRAEGKRIRKTSGTATGPLALMQMVNECGRGIMNGGNRRAAIWAGLHWNHPDIHKFITMKNWSKEIRELKEKDYSFPATMDMTNISVILDDLFFIAYGDEAHPLHSLAHSVYWSTIRQMLKTSEPGFSIDCGVNNGENLRNACQPASAQLITPQGIRTMGEVVIGDTIWDGHKWVIITNKVMTGIKSVKKYITTAGYFIGTENHSIYNNEIKIEIGASDAIDVCIGPDVVINKLDPQDIMDGLVIGDGSVHAASNNLVYLYIGDKDTDYFSSEISSLITKARPGLAEKAYEINTTIEYNELPKTYLRTVPDRFLFGAPTKVCGFLRGLFTANGSICGDRITLKQTSRKLIEQVQTMLSSVGIPSYVTVNKSKLNIFSNGEYLMKESYDLNITAGRSLFREKIGFIQKYKQEKIKDGSKLKYRTYKIKQIEDLGAMEVFDITVNSDQHVYWTGGHLVSNCTEITSRDDSDICNLGSINMARVESLEEMEELVELGTILLLAGTIYSDVPTAKIDQIRTKNRRLGLGLMGIHEFLLKRGAKYAPNDELAKYLEIYKKSTEIAHKWAKEWDISPPVKTRAIAPTGCQKQDTLIITDDGILELQELGDIHGDKWQSLGLGSLVIRRENDLDIATRFFNNGIAPVKNIKLSSGTELSATYNHKYRVLDGSNYSWKEVNDIKIGDKLVVPIGTYCKETEPMLFSVAKLYRTENTIKTPSVMSPQLATFIGMLFADGSMHEKGIRIACNAKEDHYKEIAALGMSLFGVEPTYEDNGRNCLSVCFNSVKLLRWLYLNGLNKQESTTIQVPPIIRCSSKNSIIAFIEGYFACDGSSSNSAKYIDTASKKMAQQLLTIIRAIGSDACIDTHKSGFGSLIYRIRWIKTKRRDETALDTKNLVELGLSNCTVDSVKEIVDGGEILTLDIEVPNSNTYIANGVVSHNTIGIVAETTTGIEPIFCVAYKRRYLKHKTWNYQYVIDPTAKRLIDSGVKPDMIEDAYSLAEDVEKRVAFQAWLQQYVDHSISSTINLPAWGSELNNEGKVTEFGNMLYRYLPKLRGITVYADGSRGGQPLTPIKYHTAIKHVGETFVEKVDKDDDVVVYETGDICDITKGGSCGA